MSNSRLEKFIYAICSMEVSDLPVPLSRIEKLWNCLITGETPDFEPLSRNEKYLMVMLDRYDISNLPAPMSRGEKLLYKIAMGETDLSDIPGYLSRYEELLKYLIENGGISGGDFEYVLHTLNQSLSILYQTVEKPVKSAILKGNTLVNLTTTASISGSQVVKYVDSKMTTNKTITIKLVIPSEVSGYIIQINNVTDNSYKRDITVTTNNYLLSLSSDEMVYWIRGMASAGWDVNNQSHTNAMAKAMIIEGDYTNTDIPYFEGMQSVKMPVLTTTGKNLFDGKFPVNSGPYVVYPVEDGTYTFSITDNDASINVDEFSLGDIDKNGDINSIRWIFDEGKYFKTNQTFTNRNLVIYPNTEEAFNKIKQRYHIQIEKGETATTYEPYKTNILTTPEDLELRGIGDVQDTLDLLTGEVTQRIGEVILNGETTANGYTSTDSYIGDYASYMSNLVDGKNEKLYIQGIYGNLGNSKDYILTNGFAQYKGFKPDNSELEEGFYRYSGADHAYICISASRFTEHTFEGVKKFLKENPQSYLVTNKGSSVKTVDLTTVDQDGQPTKLKTFNDITYVEINADPIIPSVNVEVATKIRETLSTLGLDHHDISNTQNKLGQTIDEQTENTDATMMATTEIYENL